MSAPASISSACRSSIRPWEPEGVEQPLAVDFGRGSDEQFDGNAAVDALTINGPYRVRAPATRRAAAASFLAARRQQPRQTKRACASKSLDAPRASRLSPAADHDEIETLLGFYRTAAAERGFEAGIQSAIERMLVSFNFLFRIEGDPPKRRRRVYRLDDLDLASRLSFFLWSSIPDDTLLTLAERNQLHEPAVLDQQITRMLRDPRASALVTSFGRAVARHAKSADVPARRQYLPGVRREPSPRAPA